MGDERRDDGWNTAMILGVVIAVAVLAWSGLSLAVHLAIPQEEPVARSYNTACYRALGGDKWVCGSGGEMEFQSGATLDVQSGATLVMSGTLAGLNTSGTLTADDAVVADTLTVGGAATINDAAEVTGTLTADDVVVTDTLTVGGAATINDAVEVTGTLTADDVVVTDTLTVGGAATINDAVEVTGTLTADDVVVTDTLTVGGDVDVAGRVRSDMYVSLVTTNTVLTATDSGTLYANKGATSEITLTLPSATVGYNYCIYVSAAYTITIAPDSGDLIHALTNAAGDRLQNVGTAGDSVCLVALDGTDWAPLQEVGTWSDIN